MNLMDRSCLFMDSFLLPHAKGYYTHKPIVIRAP